MTAITYDSISVNAINSDNVWKWIRAGWQDMWRRPAASLGYGILITAMSWIVIGCLYFFNLVYLMLPFAAAFIFAGPLLAVGVYEISRQYDPSPGNAGPPRGFFSTPRQVLYMGVLLVLFGLAWIRIATLLFALFFGASMPPLDEFFPSLFLTADGAVFLALGTMIGGILAFTAFVVSAVSIPLLLDRDVDIFAGVATSIKAVSSNVGPMLLWAWVVAVITGLALIPLMLGLIIAFPLLGHATWHCYRDLVTISEG